MVLLSLKDVSVTYHSGDKDVHAINHISLDIEKGKSLGIVGESGSGKTTLIMAILRLLPAKQAEVTGQAVLNGKDLFQLTANELSGIRWEEIAIVFQKAMNALSPVHKIGKFMSDIYLRHRPTAKKPEAKEAVIKLLEMVNLPPRVYNLYPHELSGGMMQRVSIAMSLMFNPSLLIMDEATTALDVVTQNAILEEIVDLEKKMGITRVMITHDISVVAGTCQNVAVLYAGSLLEFGDVNDVLVNPLHPYTKGLVDSFPKFDTDVKEPLSSIAGSLPNLTELPEGCVFAPRCKYACELCIRKKPELRTFSGNRKAACHFAGGEKLE